MPTIRKLRDLDFDLDDSDDLEFGADSDPFAASVSHDALFLQQWL